ncbi:hypothetical protein A9Q88_04495 [Gammaproteobacteria bacterium 50_400_T64]|nr:hypothetical protein A9Q88_04495 [Gammaproteobacteria bacterium 50_400_T64]
MNQKLKQSVHQFYTDKTLSNTQHEQLNNLIISGKSENVDKPSNSGVKNTGQETSPLWKCRINSYFGVKGSIAAAISCISLALLMTFLLSPHSANIQAVATEVASNHSHLKPLTIQSNSYSQVREFFSELSFELKPSSLLDKQRWKLLGGRYCSINGIKAAQLRLLDTENNSVQTFYQVEHRPKYFENIPKVGNNELPLSVAIDGVPVEVWSEGGILYSLTHSPRP